MFRNPWKRIAYLESRIENKEEECFYWERECSRLRSKDLKAERENKGVNKVAEHQTNNPISNIHFSEGRPFEILNEYGYVLSGPGYATEKEAVEAAQKLAAENPTTGFMVVGPYKFVKADIPVKTENWKPAK